MSGKPKTHRERSALAAELALAVSKIRDPLPGMTILITGETFPAELVKAAQRALRCLELIPAASVGDLEAADADDCMIALGEALTLYEESP